MPYQYEMDALLALKHLRRWRQIDRESARHLHKILRNHDRIPCHLIPAAQKVFLLQASPVPPILH